MNIFSHLLPVVAFLVGGWYMLGYLGNKYHDLHVSDYGTFSLFSLATAGYLSLSEIYYTMINYSHNIRSL